MICNASVATLFHLYIEVNPERESTVSEFLSPAKIRALKKEILSFLHCALPGIVASFDNASGTASVRLAVSGMPVLQDVPMFVCNGVSVGDVLDEPLLDSVPIQIPLPGFHSL